MSHSNLTPVADNRKRSLALTTPPCPLILRFYVSRDSSYRSAPVSPRHSRSIDSWSSGGPKIVGSPFFATAQSIEYQKEVVAAAERDGSSDQMNASIRHANDPVIRESLGKPAGTEPDTSTSPRKVQQLCEETLCDIFICVFCAAG